MLLVPITSWCGMQLFLVLVRKPTEWIRSAQVANLILIADTPFEDGTFKLVLQFDETYVSIFEIMIFRIDLYWPKIISQTNPLRWSLYLKCSIQMFTPTASFVLIFYKTDGVPLTMSLPSWPVFNLSSTIQIQTHLPMLKQQTFTVKIERNMWEE